MYRSTHGACPLLLSVHQAAVSAYSASRMEPTLIMGWVRLGALTPESYLIKRHPTRNPAGLASVSDPYPGELLHQACNSIFGRPMPYILINTVPSWSILSVAELTIIHNTRVSPRTVFRPISNLSSVPRWVDKASPTHGSTAVSSYWSRTITVAVFSVTTAYEVAGMSSYQYSPSVYPITPLR